MIINNLKTLSYKRILPGIFISSFFLSACTGVETRQFNPELNQSRNQLEDSLKQWSEAVSVQIEALQVGAGRVKMNVLGIRLQMEDKAYTSAELNPISDTIASYIQSQVAHPGEIRSLTILFETSTHPTVRFEYDFTKKL